MSAASSCHGPHSAGSTYVVRPTMGLATLEHPLALVVRHDLVEECLFCARVREVVVDDLVAEEPPRDAALLEPLDRLAQRVREPLRVGLVRIALERRRQLELLLDPVQPRPEE